MRRILLALAGLGFVIVGAFACEQETPAPSSTPDAAAAVEDSSSAETDAAVTNDSAATTCALHFGSKKCDECAVATCCAEVNTCLDKADCKAFFLCYLDCFGVPDGGGCTSACEAKYPDADKDKQFTNAETCVYFSKPCLFECSTEK